VGEKIGDVLAILPGHGLAASFTRLIRSTMASA
jgi:hypothetical protein